MNNPLLLTTRAYARARTVASAFSAVGALHQYHACCSSSRTLIRSNTSAPGISTSQQSRSQKLFYSSDAVKPANNAQKAVLSPKYASVVKGLFKWFLPQYQGQTIGKAVYQKCSSYPDFDSFWVKECQLPETFQTWFSTTSLYVWMAMVRVRADPDAKHYNQGLVDAFFRDTEARIRKSGVKSSRIVNDTLKDLVSSFKGTVMSLDEGFASSDAVLAAAIWRNIVPVDEAIVQVDAVTCYVRKELQRLDKCQISDITSGSFAFEPVHFASEA
ncbi:Ubiquinol cytochrome-c reductase assembly protein Cbp3 [Coemansia asiatica]|uniref:Ubiquinol cytochrome-c reductase assembly protein Cbp3 n=1 Tax=Coemansia asiatica TaxID=1052880 RepID=A0A9W7XPK4_9FUNG|nr:Ubiquinol cytochrome-c reductase assembly protein Cbp3 [Coemansia asiatica]KAJ2869838.1 Ubiquinol cytochrome-c reductase assembly protein Cbp3 [Coemansia asiatica]